MIAKLRGLIAKKDYKNRTVLLDVNGVFYRLSCSLRSFDALAPEGDEAVLEVELQFRDNALFAFGFIDEVECRWFSILTNIQGIGGKLCMVILSALPPEKLLEAIMLKDKAIFTSICGVGDRLSGRIIGELSGRDNLPVASNMDKTMPAPSENMSRIRDDTVSALINLGFEKQTAFRIVSNKISQWDDSVPPSLDVLIRQSLKELSL